MSLSTSTVVMRAPLIVLPFKDRKGRFSGELPRAVIKEIAQRLQAGERYDDISAAVGLGQRVGRVKCAAVAKALGLPAERKPSEIFYEQVCALHEEGLSDSQIADRLGRAASTVSHVRRRVTGAKYSVTRLTVGEHALIDQMLRDGFSQREIAREIGCHQTLVSLRFRKLAPETIKPVRPPCRCGKPAGHGSHCNLIVDAALIRQKLLAGDTCAEIARLYRRSAKNFKCKYLQHIIEEMTARGEICPCGQPYGHSFACKHVRAKRRLTFTEDQFQQAEPLVREGAAPRTVSKRLAITLHAARRLVVGLRKSLAEQRVLCPCGQPLDHVYTCAVRNAVNGMQVERRTAFRFTRAAAENMPAEHRKMISKLARAGQPLSVICQRTGESEWRVSTLVAELVAAGLTPTTCVNCEKPYLHKAPCPLPKLCKCGRRRNHSGACRQAGPKLTVKNGGKPPKLDPEVHREVMTRYRSGYSIRSISRTTGVSFTVLQRFFAFVRKKSHSTPKPCICGRPARHSGSCIKNSPAAVSKLEKKRIASAIKAGIMPHQIAEQLGLQVVTIMKHSRQLRDELYAQGITCACGRPIGHNYWCSAKWDAFGRRRGRVPFPEPQETQAIEALLAGEPAADIAMKVGFGKDSIYRLRRSLTPEQRDQRARACRARLAVAGKVRREDIMARVSALIPRTIDGMLRDDIEAELCLAVMEGRVELDQLKAVARSFINKGYRQWQNQFGPRSLDEKLGEDGDRTLVETIEDTTMVDQLEAVTIGGLLS